MSTKYKTNTNTTKIAISMFCWLILQPDIEWPATLWLLATTEVTYGSLLNRNDKTNYVVKISIHQQKFNSSTRILAWYIYYSLLWLKLGNVLLINRWCQTCAMRLNLLRQQCSKQKQMSKNNFTLQNHLIEFTSKDRNTLTHKEQKPSLL